MRTNPQSWARAAYKHAERAMAESRKQPSVDLRDQSQHALGMTRAAMTDDSQHLNAMKAHDSAHRAHFENGSREAATHHLAASAAHQKAQPGSEWQGAAKAREARNQ